LDADVDRIGLAGRAFVADVDVVAPGRKEVACVLTDRDVGAAGSVDPSAFTPNAVLSDPVVLSVRAESPLAVLAEPVRLKKSAADPVAVLKLPWVLSLSAELPVPVFLMPEVLPTRAESPVAVLALPVLLLRSAWKPTAVFWVPVVLLTRASDPNALSNLLPLAVLVSGVQVPPMVALNPTQVSNPVCAAAMVTLASTMRTAAAELRTELVTVFINLSSLYVVQ
jgi:hypothetical protein